MAGVVVYALFLLLRPGGWGQLGRRELWLGLGVVAATTSAGKLLGLLMAQRRLKRVIREIQAQWRPQQAENPGEAAAYTEERRTRVQARASRCCGRPETPFDRA